MTRKQVLVAGGGLAGAAVAAELARESVDVTVIEREAAPAHKICGEFLSGEAQTYLSRLGLDLAVFKAAPISHLRLVRGRRTIETALPFRGIGISRRRLDEALLLHAEKCGARVLRGRTVRNLSKGARPTLDVEGEGVMAAQALLLATGKHELRGEKRDAAIRQDLIGFKMYFRLSAKARAAVAGHIELIFYAGGYAGLQLIEDNVANLCLLVSRERFAACGGTWPGLLDALKLSVPHLAMRLENAAPLLPHALSIYRMPYGFVYQAKPEDSPHLYRLGDQACVIHSFTGDGMAIALHSAALAAQAVLQGSDAGTYHRRLSADVSGQMKRADAFYTLLNTPVSQSAIFAMASLWPGSLRMAAASTRIKLQARL